jgi:hypothetical protein
VEKKKKCHYSLLAAYQSHRPWKRKSGRVEKEGREKGPLKRKRIRERPNGSLEKH